MRLSRATWPIALALRGVGRRIRFPGRERLLRAAFHPDRQGDFRFEVDLDGLVYPGRADSFIDWNVLFHGLYEADDIRLLAALADRLYAPVFLDIGANTGHHSLVMARHAAVVHAFEPNPDARRVLDERVARNRLDNIVVHDRALGLEDRTARLYVGDRHGYPGASFLPGANATRCDRFVDVDIRNGDRYLTESGIDKLDLVKIDVEGFEFPALRGLASSIERDRPVLLVENSEAGRAEIHDLAGFRAEFPGEYRFHLAGPARGARAPGRLVPLDDIGYRTGGNVFCIPAELTVGLGIEG